MVIMWSAVSMLSLISTGMPCSGPRGPLALRSASRLSAIDNASGFISMIAFTAGPRLSLRGVSISSMRAEYSSTSDRAVKRPDFMPSCNSEIVISSNSKGLTAEAGGVAVVISRAALRAGVKATAVPAIIVFCKNLRREECEVKKGMVLLASTGIGRTPMAKRLFKHELLEGITGGGSDSIWR